MACAGASLGAQTTIENRIKGALMGSVIGDALGRIAMGFDDREDLKITYGETISQHNFPDSDWLRDAHGNKVALLSEHAFITTKVLHILTFARKNNLNRDEIAGSISEVLLKMFGNKRHSYDPFFDQRSYSMASIAKGEALEKLYNEGSFSPWWKRPLSQVYNAELLAEADSGALARAWPVAVVFCDNVELTKDYAAYLSSVTHRHPSARAAATALAIGVLSALQGLSIDEIALQMIRASEAFEHEERLYKPYASKIRSRKGFTAEKIANNEMMSSDMLRYALHAAKSGNDIHEILGISSKRKSNNRSYRGALLGYQADEAVAAALYLLLKYPNDYNGAIQAAVHAGGNSSLVASLAGALIGAHNGFTALENKGLPLAISALEEGERLTTLYQDAFKVVSSAQPYVPRKRSSSSFFNTALKIGVVGVGAWLAYKYVVPYFMNQKNQTH
jgi:ADP-ribosylglycohydrolase